MLNFEHFGKCTPEMYPLDSPFQISEYFRPCNYFITFVIGDILSLADEIKLHTAVNSL